VLCRNTRASIEGFPQRRFHPHLLEAPDGFPDSAADVELGTLLTPELLLGDGWLDIDSRVSWLAEFIQQQRAEKILVICSRAGTALELEQYLREKHGLHSAVFHEGLSLVARDRAAAWFADEEEGAQVLICSEIGSEGRNFQFSHQLVLFDLPLNPDLLEQRIGRLDRIGQRHEVCVHVPCYQHSAQEVMLRWYHEGINAFEQTCAIGQTMYQQFGQILEDCLRHPSDQSGTDQLVEQTSNGANALLEDLRNGRDRLLELNSCDKKKAEQVVEDIHEQEQRHALAGYMERVFNQFGVEQEHHSTGSIVLHPGEHMLEHSFPGLPEDGLTATYQREVALSREEFQYLSWEHPMVTGAMDMVLSGDFGNTALCTLKLPPLKAGTILLEAIFTMSCPAPADLQLHRYLPLTSIRVVVDSKNNDLSSILKGKHFNKLGQNVRRHTAQDFVRQTRAQIVTMIKAARELASPQQASIIARASDTMQSLQKAELNRLQALAQVNPNIRQDEIEHLQAETDELQDYLDTAQIKLEALRVVVVTD
jgi:ATP-dependent helicase HepA